MKKFSKLQANNWYILIFLENDEVSSWEQTMKELREEEIIWGMLKINNLYFFGSHLNTADIRELLLSKNELYTSFFIHKIDVQTFLKIENTQLLLVEEHIVEHFDDDSLIIIPKNNRPKNQNKTNKKEKKLKNEDNIFRKNDNKEEILNSILDKIGKIGYDKLSEKEKEFLKNF